MPKSHIVKVFGERNTGTRAAIAMIAGMPDVGRRVTAQEQDPSDGALVATIEAQMRGSWRRLYLHALRDEASARRAASDPWKHAAPVLTDEMAAARVKTLFMLRNPYSWFLSLARRPYHMKGPGVTSLEAFAARPWMTERREGLPAVLSSPVELWSRKLSAMTLYRRRARDAGLGCVFVSFEDFVADPVRTLGDGLFLMGIQPQGLQALPMNSKTDDPDPEALQSYYADEAWRERLTSGLVRRINGQVDWSMAVKFGYRQLDPDLFPDQLDPHLTRIIKQELKGLGARANVTDTRLAVAS